MKEIKSKIYSLRTYYAGELKKKADIENKGLVHESKWAYYDSLEFLLGVLNMRSSKAKQVSYSTFHFPCLHFMFVILKHRNMSLLCKKPSNFLAKIVKSNQKARILAINEYLYS